MCRCDIKPKGWQTNAGGKDVNPLTWRCTNQTLGPVAEEPSHCQFTDFWSFPRMAYVGPDVVNGYPCDKWVYTQQEEEYAFWAADTTPIATGKILSNRSYDLWVIYFEDFIPGTPPDSAFSSVTNVCPPSKPESFQKLDARSSSSTKAGLTSDFWATRFFHF